MLKTKRIMGVPLLLLLWVACQPKVLKPSDYRAYYAENIAELSDRKTTEGILLNLSYRPLSMLIVNDLGMNLDASQFEESKSKFCEHLYFTLDVVKNDPLSKTTSRELRDYFSHDRQGQFVLITAQDTLPCALYHPELVNQADKQVRINLIFPRPSQNPACDVPLLDDLKVRFYDERTDQFISFLIQKDKINQLPTVKI